MGKVIVTVALPPEGTHIARNETMPSGNSYPPGAPAWLSRALPSEIAMADLMEGVEPPATAELVEVAVLPFAFPNSYFFDVAIHAGLSAIAAIGLNLLMGFAGQIDAR
ncbi:MAG TPA: hypothetical protein PKV70_05775, partial [Thermodesulfobacteriota bacterium]|nr:hypothetical protein [Thermodesulfobacteriota bacterium]